MGKIPPMRILPICWSLGAILLFSMLYAEDSPSGVLQRARDRAGNGDLSTANSYVRTLLSQQPGDVALWEEAIRLQAQWGSLKEAYWHARRLNLRKQLGGGSATPLPVYLEMQSLLGRELDEVLSWTSLADIKKVRPGCVGELVELLKLTTAFSPEKSAKVVQHVFSLMRSTPTGKLVAHDAAAAFLVELGEVPETSATVIQLAEASGLTTQRDWCEAYASRVMGSRAWDRPGCLPTFLAQSTLTAAVGQFRDLDLPQRPEGTLMGVFAAELRKDHNTAWRWEALQVLEAQSSPSFGASLLLHLLAAQGEVEGLRKWLTEHQRDLAALSDQAAGQVLTVLKSRHELLSGSDPLDPGLRALLAPLLEAEKWHLDGVRLDWRRVSGIEEMKLTPGAARSLAIATLQRLVVHDPALAREYLADVVRLMRDSDSLIHVLLEAAREPDLIATVLKLADTTRIASDPEWEKRALLKAWERDEEAEHPQRMVTVLEAAGLLGEAREVLKGWRDGPSPNAGFLANVIEDVSSNPKKAAALLPSLEQRHPETFGRDLLIAFLKPEVKQGLLAAARKHRAALAELPADQRAMLATFLTWWVGSEVALANAVPGFAEALKVSVTERTTVVLAELARLVDVSSPGDLYPNAAQELAQPHAAISYPSKAMLGIAEVLAEAMVIDPAEAAYVFTHVSALVYAADRAAAQRMPDKRLGVQGLWLMAAMDHRVLHPLVQKELGKIVLQRMDYFWVEKAEKRMLPPEDFTDAVRMVSRMERCGILAPDAEYQPLNLARYCSMPETLSRRMVDVLPATKAEAVRLLEARPLRSFGTVLMIAFLQPTWQEADRVLGRIRGTLGSRPVEDALALRRALVKLFPDIEQNPAAASGDGMVAFLEKLQRDSVTREVKAQREPGGAPAVASTLAGREATLAEMSRMTSAGDMRGAHDLFKGLLNSAGPPVKTPAGEMLVWLCRERGRQRLLESCFENRRPPVLSGFLLGSASMDETGQLGLAGTLLADDVAASLELAWVESAGLVQPAVAAEEVLAAFAQGMGSTPAYVAAPSFSRWLAGMPAAARQDVLAWSSQAPSDKPWKHLATELHRTGLLGQTAGQETSERAAVLSHYANCLQDPAVPVSVRLDLGAYLCRAHARGLPPSIVQLTAGLALRSWQKGDLNRDNEMIAVFDAFVRLPEDSSWRELAEAFVARRNQLLAELAQGQRWGNSEAGRVTLALLARLNDRAAIQPLITDRDGMVEDRQLEVVVLAHHKQPGLAAGVVRREWGFLAGGLPARYETSKWTGPYSEEAATAFSAAFSNEEPDLALLGRGFLLRGAQPGINASREEKAAWQSGTMKLAADIAKSPRSKWGLRPRLDAFVVGLAPEALLPLADSLASDAADEAWQVGESISQSSYEGRAMIIAVHDAVRVLDGDLDVMSGQMSRLGEIVRLTENYDADDAMTVQAAYLKQLLTTVAGNASKLTLAQRSALMSRVDRLLQGLGGTAGGTGVPYPLQNLRWVVDRWMQARGSLVPPAWTLAELERHDTGFLTANLKLLAELAVDSPGVPALELRARLAVSVAMTKEMYLPAGERWKNFYDLLLTSGLLTRDELVMVSPELLAAMRHSGKAALELAALANELGDQAKAERLLEMGLSDAVEFDLASLPLGHFDAGERAAARRSLVIRRASLLIAMKQGEKARQVLAPLGASADDKAVSRLLKLAGEAAR